MQKQTTLFIFSGLPGVGKTTLAKLLAQHLTAFYLRIDTVEQGIKDLCQYKVVEEGYKLSHRLAKDNLDLGISVIADSTNPISITRDDWRQVAIEAKAQYIDIFIHCSNKTEHKKRIETRKSDIKNLNLPTWQSVIQREFTPWQNPYLTIDTANKPIEQSFSELLKKLKSYSYL